MTAPAEPIIPSMAHAQTVHAHKSRRWAEPLLIFSLSFLLLVASLPLDAYNFYDEGLILFGAQRILDGDLPYRDFLTLYAPGQFYAVAALFKLTAPSILVERLWDLACRAGIVAMVFLWVRRLDAGAYSYAASLITFLLLGGMSFHGFPVFPALLFALIGGYLVLGVPVGARPSLRLFAAGACAGLAALFRHDIGFYVVAAETLALVLAFPAPDGTAPQTGWIAQRARMILALGLGALAIVGPVAIWLLVKISLHDLWFDLFYVTATNYPKMRALPFPSLLTFRDIATFCDSLCIYFPLVVAPAALVYLAMSRGDAAQSLQRFGILLLALITLLMYLKGVVRVSTLHLLQSIIPAIILFFVLLSRLEHVSNAWRKSALVLGAIAALVLCAEPARIAIKTAAGNVRALARSQLCIPNPGLERARCFTPRSDDVSVVKFIESHTQPGEPIFVGTGRHDRIFVNNILIYFLADRPPATRWYQFEPGIQTSAPVQTEIIGELKTRNVRLLVLNADWDTISEPNASAISSGVTLLDDYIRADFETVAQFGGATIWQRR